MTGSKSEPGWRLCPAVAVIPYGKVRIVAVGAGRKNKTRWGYKGARDKESGYFDI